MSSLTLYQLQPRTGGGFHFGQEGLDLEESSLTFASDSLFSALVVALAELEGDEAVTDFADSFQTGQPPFRLSTLFPYVGHLPLFPLPRLRINAKQVARKFTKDVKFVSPAIFRRLCQGDDMAAYLDTAQKGRFWQNESVWLSKQEADALPAALVCQKIWQHERVPRVTLDRLHGNSTPFRSGRITFNKGCGLWLAVQYHDERSRSRLELLLHHLGDRGIGGERTNGYGAYTLVTETELVAASKWMLSDDLPGRLLLSRYIPTPAEVGLLQEMAAAYQLTTIGGWLYSSQHPPLRRKKIRMLTEGSVLPGQPSGTLVDVQPDYDDFPHPVYRSGLALSVPVAL